MAPWCAIALIATLASASLFLWSQKFGDELPDAAFRAYMVKYGKEYPSHEEYLQRRAAFEESVRYVLAENAKGHSYTLELNEFADQTPEEFGAARLGLAAAHPWAGATFLGSDEYSGAALPVSVDWVAKGAVSPPKNQARCGSCWAFSSTGALEGRWQIATGKLVSLSEQQLVDCDKMSMGCRGGSMQTAFQYWESHAACTEESYGYHAKNGKCHASNCTAGVPQGGVVGFKNVPHDNTEALMEAVSEGPVSVAIEADQRAFQLYHGGVLAKGCGDKLDHGVLIVGYGTTSEGVEYWKVKNSWGAAWGEHGYLRMERGAKAGVHGECGIKDQASYPVVKGKTSAADAHQTIAV